MIASERKIKRTQREKLMLIENMNRTAIERLMNDHVNLIQIYEETMKIVANYQLEILAIKNILKRHGLLDDLEIAQERSRIQELIELEKKAKIIGENEQKAEDKTDAKSVGENAKEE